MGEIYARGIGNMVWLGEPEGSGPACMMFNADYAPAQEHPRGCRCKQDELKQNFEEAEGIETVEEQAFGSAAETASLAVPALIRLATIQDCDDLRACRVFLSSDDMRAFKKIVDVLLGTNPWFERIWVIQEVIRAPVSTCFIGHVGFPLDALYYASHMVLEHYTNVCCRGTVYHVYRLGNTAFWKCKFLQQISLRLRQQESLDLLRLLVRLPGRRAMLDVDLVYGVLGITSNVFAIQPD